MPKDTRIRFEISAHDYTPYAFEWSQSTLGWARNVITGKELDARRKQLKMIYGLEARQ